MIYNVVLDKEIVSILNQKYEINLNKATARISRDKDKFFSFYVRAKEILSEFGYNDDKLLADNILKFINTDRFRERCLILEYFKCLDIFLEKNTDKVFSYSADTLYAKLSYYKNEIENDGTKTLSFGGFMTKNTYELKERGYLSIEEMKEKYPLTEKSLKLMERIHNAKLRKQAQNNEIR